MLTAAARASLRRVAVSLPLRPVTAPLAARSAPALLARPFSTTPRAAEAAAKKAPAKKKKTPAAKKPAPKKKKKALSPEEKEKAEIRALKKAALFEEPAKKPEMVWRAFIKQEMEGKPLGDGLASAVRAASEKFKALSTSEVESLQSQVDANRATNASNYKAWVESHTPEEIHNANLARRRLVHKGAVKGTNAHRKIVDERLPKRPANAFSLFVKERWAAGHLSGNMSTHSAEIGHQWNALPEGEKRVYQEKAARDLAEYTERVKAVLEGRS